MPKFKSSGETVNKTNEQLKDEELKVLMASSGKLASLKPQISDKAAFDQLVAVVSESTKKNENVAQLQARLSTLGEAVVGIAKKVMPLLV
jgi:hypothetical protein